MAPPAGNARLIGDASLPGSGRSGGRYIWNNTGDTAKLKDNYGGTVDSCTYTGTSTGYVYC